MTVLPEKNFDIKKLTSFKIGGKISEVFFPENIEEFVQILKENLMPKCLEIFQIPWFQMMGMTEK